MAVSRSPRLMMATMYGDGIGLSTFSSSLPYPITRLVDT